MQRQTVYLVTSGECGWAAVRLALESLPDVDVVEASNVDSALEAMRDSLSDLTFVSPDMANALIAGQSDPSLPPIGRRVRLVIIGSRLGRTNVWHQEQFEVVGHLLWHDLTAGNLPSVLATLLTTRLLLTSPEVAQEFLKGLHPAFDVPHLTDQERQITRLLAEGFTDKEIAEYEQVSERTVERLVTKLLAAFDVRSRFALGVAVARHGLLDQSGG